MIELSIDIPEGFLNEEIICDYKVSRQIKELWAVELDLMAQLDRVCKAHNLSYCAGAGTLLGAVRHKGFIPWDDDMDFYMLRDDYDKLMDLANEFEEPYFLQNGLTDPNYMRKHARLRNSHTTACANWEKDLPGNMGIFIDIFPLDGISDNALLDKIQKYKNQYYRMLIKEPMKVTQTKSLTVALKRLFRNTLIAITHRNKIKSFKLYDQSLKQYSCAGTKLWGNRTIVFDCPKSRRPIEDWQDIITVPYEFMQIPIPHNYDEILKQQYGAYMQFPRNKKSGKMHQLEILSTDYSYTELISKHMLNENSNK